jgi:hypothetical protein
MMQALNQLWPHRSLGWESAAAVWRRRRPLGIDRSELRLDVEQRGARLRERLGTKRCAARMARRLAIEQALDDRGLVRGAGAKWMAAYSPSINRGASHGSRQKKDSPTSHLG